MIHKIFISAPLSSYASADYVKGRNQILELISSIKFTINNVQLFYAGEQLNELYNFQDPVGSLRMDVREIEVCDIFILIYPSPLVTSALVEIGYAMCLKKSIGIFTKEREMLPFLLQQCDSVYENISIHRIEDNLITKVIDYLVGEIAR